MRDGAPAAQDAIDEFESVVKRIPGWPEIVIKPRDESLFTNPRPSSPSETLTVSGEGERAVAETET